VEYLNKLADKKNFPKKGKELFALLTIPEKLSKVQEEEKMLLRLAGHKDDKLKLKKHAEKFRYMGYNFEGPAFPDSYFERRLKEARRDKISPENKIKKMTEEKIKARFEERKIIKQLKIDKKHQTLLAITKGLIYSKEYRKMSLVESYYHIDPLLKELAKRFHLSLAEIRNCLLGEIEQMAKGSIKRPKDLTARMKGFIFVVLDGKLPGEVIVDQRFSQMKRYLLKTQDFSEVNSFHGQPACLGKARGKVRIINTIKDLAKMKKGDILVSQMTNPDLVPAMKIAGAIVTDLGGITSHAAIVSRELKVPCVIGTKIATKVLKDGDMVEVDANSGDIRKI
jgi:phosphoenolpyruvate synthase/pyruvate phosphate dikinase